MNYKAVKEYEPLFKSILNTIPGCVIAGGFIRDVLTDNTPSDIDIWITNQPTERQLFDMGKLFDGPFVQTITSTDVTDGTATEYVQDDVVLEYLRELWECDDGKPFAADIIRVSSLNYLGQFPDNLSLARYDDSGLWLSEAFLSGHQNKELIWSRKPSDKRLWKIRRKFPDYKEVHAYT